MRILFNCAMLLFLANFQSWGQPKKVIGYSGDGFVFYTKFVGDKFTVLRNDGFAIVNLEGKDLLTGIKVPKVAFKEDLWIDYGVFFSKEKDHIVLKDISGKILGTGKFQKITPFVSNITAVELKNTTSNTVIAYIDTSGKEIARFDKAKYLAIIPQNKKTGLTSFDANSMFLSNFLPFRDGLTPMEADATHKFGFINKNLKLAIPAQYSAVESFSEGLAAVRNDDGNWGYVNTAGKLIIPYHYSRRPSRFSSGRAKVESQEGKHGYIDKDNKLIIPAIYDHATTFYKGYALVRKNFNTPVELIDSMGNLVSTFPKGSYIDNAKPPIGIYAEDKGEYPFYISETLKQLVDHGKGIFNHGMSYGLVDIKGNIVLDFNYKLLADYHAGKMFAHWTSFVDNSTKRVFGIINDKGELVIEIVQSEF